MVKNLSKSCKMCCFCSLTDEQRYIMCLNKRKRRSEFHAKDGTCVVVSRTGDEKDDHVTYISSLFRDGEWFSTEIKEENMPGTIEELIKLK